jgi:hypothetical protein
MTLLISNMFGLSTICEKKDKNKKQKCMHDGWDGRHIENVVPWVRNSGRGHSLGKRPRWSENGRSTHHQRQTNKQLEIIGDNF